MFTEYDHSQKLSISTPTGFLPDEMIPLLNTTNEDSQPTPNLDILLSKLLNNDELNDIQLQQLGEKDRVAVQSVKKRSKQAKKRPDEYQKLFFKRAFKYAQKEYFGKCKNKSRKMSSFYHHYFEVTAQKMNIPLVNFYHPDKKTKPGLITGQKSFNLSYIKLLLKSDSFREVSRSYHKHFKDDCIAQRKNKIPKFINYLKNVIDKHGNQPQKMMDLIRSSKCKVPWTNSQIQQADKRALAELQSSYSYYPRGGDQQQEMDEEFQSELSNNSSSE